MEVISHIKRSVYIFCTIFCLCFGCEHVYKDCFIDVYCSTTYINLNDISYNVQDYCYYQNYKEINNNGYSPVRITIESESVVDHVLSSIPDHVSNIIVSLEITSTSLAETPDFNQMSNLKLLNLSNNNLHVAKLYNKATLMSLKNIDLSHNSINSINIDINQYVYENLRILNLSNNFLTNVSDGVFERFRYLENLDLSYNKIIDIDQYSFEGLKNIKYLSLSYNNISDISISLFRFSHLEELYLDNNNIENLSSQNFEACKSLVTLNLDYNIIRSIHKNVFNNTVSLTTLKLHYNLLNHIDKDAFSSTSLKTIDLSNNLLINLPKDLFINKNVTSFSITGNNLQGNISRGTFEGLQLITELDVSYQGITAVENLAFFGFAKITTLLLNNNEIRTISEGSFKTLMSLKHLDLSYNLIMTLDFSKIDLVSLETFSLAKNFIEEIIHEDLQDLNKLRFLDLSNNNISKLETSSFNTMETIESIKLFNNPINGALLNGTFHRMHLVPVLDLSHSAITSIQNGSLSGMLQLQEFNISRSSVNNIEYSAFTNTGSIKSIDLSFNKIVDLFVNGNDLKNLTTIYLNNNAIFQISNYFFEHMTMLSKIVLSYNLIQDIDDNCFTYQTDLRYLDVSFNNNLTFRTSAINNSKSLDKLLLSSIKKVKDFTYIGNIPITKLQLSYLGIHNMSMLHLNSMRHLTGLVISHNNIAKVELSALKNMSDLEWLDFSFNNISFIQTGSFKDNTFLLTLNLSHNALTSLSYGIFRGLINLNLLDLSYNCIHDLGRARFYDTQSLKILIADHNRIEDVSNDFFGIHLDLLSIGHNPLSCERVISLKQLGFKLGAVNIDESNGDNVDGITCNMINHIPESRTHGTKTNTTSNEQILMNIRDILLNASESQGYNTFSNNGNSEVLKKILNKLIKYGDNQSSQLNEIKSKVSYEINSTNIYLDKILKVALGFGFLQNRLIEDNINKVTLNKYNKTDIKNNTLMVNNSKLDLLLSDVNQIKLELLNMRNVISEVDTKISLVEALYTPSKSDNFNNSYHVIDDQASKSLIFLEVCVSLTLLILICFLLYKFYEGKIVQQSRSLSTRHITDAMENSNL